jgi:hypothetical protein
VAIAKNLRTHLDFFWTLLHRAGGARIDQRTSKPIDVQ